MVESFTIKGFKQFTHLFLQSLKTITLLGGKNNTGKTSVLEAFFMFFDSANPEIILKHLSWRGLGSMTLNPDSLWFPLFNSHS